MVTYALLRDSSDLHIYEDLFWERNKPEKKTNSSAAFFVCCVIF